MNANRVAKASSQGSTGSYVPSYHPPPEPPAAQPAPTVNNRIEVPATMQITTMTDLVDRIQENASILFPSSSRLKVTTALAGLLCYAVVVCPKNEQSKMSRYKVILKGPGVPGGKNDPGKGRREALVGLLEELEKRVGKEMLSTGA